MRIEIFTRETQIKIIKKRYHAKLEKDGFICVIKDLENEIEELLDLKKSLFDELNKIRGIK